MSVIHAPRKPDLDARQILLLIAVGSTLVTLMLRLWYIQVYDAAAYRSMAEKYRHSAVDKLAPRGLVYDRKMRLIAGIQTRYVVTGVPATVLKKLWVLDKIADMTGTPVEKLREKIDAASGQPYLPTPLTIGASIDVATKIAEASYYLPGIGVDSVPLRSYAEPVTLSHLLGYVWTPDVNDVERFQRHEWTLPQYVGKSGLEWSMEKDLMGSPGSETVEVDSRRRPLRLIGRKNSHPGTKLVLTIDKDLQAYAYNVLATVHPEFPNSGAAMAAIDPKTGEVLALASYPSIDASLFSGGISKADYETLSNDPLQPMFDRAVAGSYSPGSTFKIVTALAAQQCGYFDPNRTVLCRGYYEIGNKKIKCLGTHGRIAFREALARSCNAYFGDMAAHVGRNGLNNAAIAYGLGYKTGIELRGETGGSLPTDKWLKKLGEREHRKVQWFGGNTVNVGIGQGEVSASVLQMANAIAAVANGGVNYKPHLVKARIIDRTTVPVSPEIAHQIDASPAFWSELQAGLRAVIDHGTASGPANIPGVVWAGKTGSTEANGNALTHSWFIGYAPADNPRIAIAVVVEKAGHGAKVAVPLATQIVRHYLQPPASP